MAFPVLLGLVCLLGGASLSLTAISHIAAVGANAPYVHNLMALSEPASQDLTDVLGPAAASVDNLTFYLTIGATAVAATLLLVAAGFFLTAGRLRHPDAARRVAGVGLWLALGVAIVNVIPFDAGWEDAALGSPGGSAFEAVRTGVVALAGLLLLQISAPQWRESVREAFRD
jgi:hypothetical protein